MSQNYKEYIGVSLLQPKIKYIYRPNFRFFEYIA
jgi:hypothetical protein